MERSLSEQPRVFYPEEGEKLGQGVVHFLIAHWLFDGAFRLFQRRGGFVGSDLFFYYQEEDARSVVAPDLLIKQHYSKSRHPWRLWVDGIPDLVGEVCSDTTGDADVTWKLELYQRLGIRYYFVFDPERRYVTEGLRAYELKRGRYERLAVLGATAYFPMLEMGIRMEGERLRVVDATGRPVRSAEEEGEGREAAEKVAKEQLRAREEAERIAEERHQAFEAAEQEIERLWAQLAALQQKNEG